jgi:type I restriction enzyme S subunit
MEQLTPKLRFSEFEGYWKDTSLDIIGEYIGGGTPKTSIQEYWQGEIPWISSSDIIENDIHNINVQKYITEDAVINSATKKIPERSLIIVSRVGVGKFAINSTEVCTSQDFTNIVIDKESYDPNFAAFNLYKNIEVLFNISQGTSIKGFTITELKKTKLSFPSLQEQTKIASFLSAVDEKLNLLKEKKAALEEYKKGMMQKIFSQEIRFKDDASAELSTGNGKDFAEWEEKSLGACLDYEQPTPYLVNSTDYNDSFETPVLTAGKTFILGYTNEEFGIYKNHPIIIFDDFTTATQYVDFPFKAKSSAMKILKTKDNDNIKFLYEAIRMINFEIGGHGRHWISVFSLMEILIPSIEEQNKIASFLSAIDEKIELVTTQIDETKEYKKGLLQQMFC